MTAHTVVINVHHKEALVPAGTTVARLADRFAAVLSEHGIIVDRLTIEQEMGDRIADIADRLHISPETVLQVHARDEWGPMMALDVIAHLHHERQFDPPGTSDCMTIPIAG